jgi:glycosyltransferase involved in cell wall biosynthesis
VHRFFSRSLAAALNRLEREVAIDVLHCENFYTAEYARRSRAKVRVLYEENYEPEILSRRQEQTDGMLLRSFLRIEEQRTIRYQVACMGWLDSSCMISSLDADKLKTACINQGREDLVSRVCAVPTGIEVKSYRNLQPSDSELPDVWHQPGANVLFVGSMNYVANEDAALWFCDEVWPRICQRTENCRLWLVGHSPSPQVVALRRCPGVFVTGAVRDVRPWLAGADVFVIPLRIGGGIRLKLLEALAAGCPVVSTAVGAEGLSIAGQQDPWAQADNLEDLAQEVLRILGDSESRQRMAEQGQSWVQENYDAEVFGQRMLDHYQQLLSEKSYS